MSDVRGNCFYLDFPSKNTILLQNIQLFRERLSGKVHATILKGIVGCFEFSVFQRNLPFGIVACTFFRQPFSK